MRADSIRSQIVAHEQGRAGEIMLTKQVPKHCYWRGDTLWSRIKVGGAEYRETLRTSDPREAARRVKGIRERLRREVVLGKPVEASAPPPGHPWEAAVERWTREVLPGAVRPRVAQRYRVSLGQLAATFDTLTIEAITTRTIAKYVSSRAGHTTNATVRRDLTALSRLLAATVAWGWREDNPARAYDRSLIRERRDPIQPPDPGDVAAFIAFAPAPMAAILRLLDATGMRAQEAVTLERHQVDAARAQIVLTQTKTGRPRTLAFKTPGGDAGPILAAAAAKGLLFPARTGEAYKNFPGNCWRVQRDLAAQEAKAGRAFRRFRVHDLRHAWAIRALKASMSIYQVSRHLGHSSIVTTERHYLGYLTWEEQGAVRQAGVVQVIQGRQDQSEAAEAA